jgi:hypothetical protein
LNEGRERLKDTALDDGARGAGSERAARQDRPTLRGPMPSGVVWCRRVRSCWANRRWRRVRRRSRGEDRVAGNSSADLAIRPIFHQTDERIEAHILVALLAYCLQVTLKQRLRSLAPGLTPRSVVDKMAAIEMVDVHLPTTDDRAVVLSRHTEPRRIRRFCLSDSSSTRPTKHLPRLRQSVFRYHNDRPLCGADLATPSPGTPTC